MNSLTTRRRLLVAEAEIHRAGLSGEWRVLSGQAAGCQQRARAGARKAAGWAAAGLVVTSGLRLLSGRGSPAGLPPSPGPVRRVFGLARTGLSLWLAFRPLFSSVTARNGVKRSGLFHARPAVG